MYLDCYDKVKHITTKLVNIPSEVKTSGEADVAKWIHNYYAELDYYKENPEHLIFQQTLNDSLERYNVLAMVKGTKGESNKTVILIGHLDTVGVEDFGHLKEHAFNPRLLPELLKKLNLGEEINKDIDSGEYMFGRGALDMKSGVAGHMSLIEYFSKHPEELNGNLIAIAEADEEDNSTGIISALKALKQLKHDHDLDYIAAINADYSTPYFEEDKNRYVYFGTIGKLLPSFYVSGKETHVGQAYGGFDPNLLIAELTKRIQLNPELIDWAHNEATVPPMSLKQSDLKDLYTVQTALAAYSYYNFFTYSLSPKEVMEKMKEVAIQAYDSVIDYMNESYREYCEISDIEFKELPWKTRVYTWDEYYNELATIHGEKYKVFINNYAKDLHERNPSMDLRDFSLKLIKVSWERYGTDKSPAVIIYYSSTFSARIEVTGKTEEEENLLNSVRNAVEVLQPYTDKPVVTKMFYPYISDSSFMSIFDDQADLRYLEKNMPAWGSKYIYPLEDILEIDVPVINIGTFGKDGHKISERVHMRYTFEHVPNMTYQTIKGLLK